jgi:hypothetical protein
MEQQVDWMTFLAAFVDECKNMAVLFEKREITQQKVLDVAGEYFIRAHSYDEPRLHEGMRHTWMLIQNALHKLVAEQQGEDKLSKEELFRKHMVDIFTEMWKLNEERIPISTRVYFRYVYEREMAISWIH